jgi:hypothetical protein
MDKDEYWSRRWLFTRAGAHSQYSEKEWFGYRTDLPERPTRREFAENCKENIVGEGEAKVDAGLSWKYEHGKTRAIYSCDTKSYFTFDYLLKPIESVWRNYRVLLDPGRTTQAYLCEKLSRAGDYKFMLDFDDFNSQHTIRSMQICVEEVCKDAPEDIRHWAVESFDSMFVHWESEGIRHKERMVGTLPSGHRATTFINTVLNAAYCRIMCGSIMDRVSSWHTGDDVIAIGGEEDISRMAKLATESEFRANPSKQSVGSRCGEFLRMAITRKEARGYLARSVASIVSGNWVTETRLDS